MVSLKKQYPGHAKRVMFGVWSFLRQFMYTKLIVTDDDVDIRDWKDVVWALTTRVDPARDTLIVRETPIDYLDFASPVAGLGSKMGIDATNKWPGETAREWGRPIAMDAGVKARWTRSGRHSPCSAAQSSGFHQHTCHAGVGVAGCIIGDLERVVEIRAGIGTPTARSTTHARRDPRGTCREPAARGPAPGKRRSAPPSDAQLPPAAG